MNDNEYFKEVLDFSFVKLDEKEKTRLLELIWSNGYHEGWADGYDEARELQSVNVNNMTGEESEHTWK